MSFAEQHISPRNSRSALTVRLSRARLRCSFSEQTAQFCEAHKVGILINQGELL